MAPIFESFSDKVHTQKGICCLFVICGPERGLTLMADYDKSSYVSSSWVLSICESGGPQTKPPKTLFCTLTFVCMLHMTRAVSLESERVAGAFQQS